MNTNERSIDCSQIIPIESLGSDDEILETYEVQEDGSLLPVTPEVQSKKLTRKRRRNPENWKRNVAKIRRQSGKAYKNTKGEVQPARKVKPEGCANPKSCPFKCMTKINHDIRQAIHNSYWNLNDSEKRHFYVSNVKRVPCKRKRSKAQSSRKTYVLNYHFNSMNEDVRVCQQFFVNTLNVSQGRVYYYFKQNQNTLTITPGALRHGKHTKKVISNDQKQGIRDHINKFPVVESHYCRQNSNKMYLYQGLNLSIMYRLYVAESENPAKFSAYRNIFNYEFNLSFFHPKKDRCDKCLSFEILSNPTVKEISDHNVHVQSKENASAQREKDRKISPADHKKNKSMSGGFDMENVFQLPITNASNAYYRRKFSELNLTAVINKIAYNAMWDESLCGREGVHVANALIKILKRYAQDNPLVEHLTLWSDSCVPQNRNSIMSAGIQCFLNSSESGRLKRIDQKFSEAGHGQVQEVDCAHSVIERFLRGKFIYSPPSLVKLISEIPEGKLKFIVLEMKSCDYWDYYHLAQAYNYSVVPYTKVKQLTYKRNESRIWFKLDFPQDFVEKTINLKPRKATSDFEAALSLQVFSKISSAKIEDIRSMFAIMPEKDKLFYENIFPKTEIKPDNSIEIKSNNTDNLTPLKKTDRKRKSSPVDIQQQPKYQSVPLVSSGMVDANDEILRERVNSKRKYRPKILSRTNTVLPTSQKRTVPTEILAECGDGEPSSTSSNKTLRKLPALQAQDFQDGTMNTDSKNRSKRIKRPPAFLTTYQL